METMELVYNYVEHICKKYEIDESHDVGHARDCVHFAAQMLEPNMKEKELQIIMIAAAVHDTVDKKYVPVKEASVSLRIFLYELGLSEEDTRTILDIVTTMSYSYVKKRREEGLDYPQHGPWQRAYHIIRHADLLCSYRVERAFQYQRRITPELSFEECGLRVAKLFEERMMRYVNDGWIFLPKAIKLVEPLFKKAAYDLRLIRLEKIELLRVKPAKVETL